MPYKFDVVLTQSKVFVLWPYTNLANYLLMAAERGARYELRRSHPNSAAKWIEVCSVTGCYGEDTRDLWFGEPIHRLGQHLYRAFYHSNNGHQIVQHGLDGLPQALFEAAVLGQDNQGNPVEFTFRLIGGERPGSCIPFTRWMDYFVSGRGGSIQEVFYGR